MQQPEVVTLCGSIRFAAEHLAAHRRLSLEGHVVLLPALPVPGDDSVPADVDVLAALHRRKIDMSDRVHIVNPGGYVGPSTAAEVAYAEATGKRVTYEHNASRGRFGHRCAAAGVTGAVPGTLNALDSGAGTSLHRPEAESEGSPMPLRIPPITAVSAAAGLAVLLGLAPPAVAAGEETPPPARSIDRFCANLSEEYQPFTDVQGETFEDGIECLAAAGVTRGGPGNRPADQYGPGLTVRRDAMASFISRLIDKADELDTGEEIRGLAPFDGTLDSTDVGAGNVHRENIDRLVEAGIVRGGPQGRPSDEYGPELEVSRAHMASFIVQALAYMTGESFETPNDYFVDDETAEPHGPNINASAASAIAIGDGQDAYEPFGTVSRGQMAGFLTRALAALEDGGLITPEPFVQDGTAPAGGTSNGPGDAMACNGGRCDGTDGNDTLVASNSAEQVIGYGGDDDVELDAVFPSGSSDAGVGGPGRDCIDGGAGGDLMIGGAGDDDRPCEFTAFVDPEAALTGGPGNDRIEGGPGNDSMNGIGDDDRLLGGSGDDLLRDGSPDDEDRLFGGTGADTLDARDGGGDDVVDGGPGDDDCAGDESDTFTNCERVTRL